MTSSSIASEKLLKAVVKKLHKWEQLDNFGCGGGGVMWIGGVRPCGFTYVFGYKNGVSFSESTTD